MSTNKRITNLTEYKFVRPYSSEMFGVNQTLIGWKSKRILDRIRKGINDEQYSIRDRLIKSFEGIVEVNFNFANALFLITFAMTEGGQNDT